MERDLVVHPSSLRAHAMRLQSAVYGGAPTDDSVIGVRSIEAYLIEQYGLIVAKSDQQLLRQGQRPGDHRLITQTLTLQRPTPQQLIAPQQAANRRWATVGTFIQWQGKPYVTGVAIGDTDYAPVTDVGALAGVARQINMPTYVVEGATLHVYQIQRTLSVQQLRVSGILADPFSGRGVNDPLRWAVPINATPDEIALMVERAEIRLKGGPVATWQRKDSTNNAAENTINSPAA